MLRRGPRLGLLMAENPHHRRMYERMQGSASEEQQRERARQEQRMPERAQFDISIHDAFKIFDFTMGSKFDEKALKKQYVKLAKKHHPDRGGSPEAFMKLKAAHKLLKTYKHDPEKAKKTEIRFTRSDGMKAASTAHEKMTDENYKTDVTDAFAALVMVPIICIFCYFRWVANAQWSSDSRDRLAPDEIRKQKEVKEAHQAWHPWKASAVERDTVQLMIDDRKERLQVPEIDRASLPPVRNTDRKVPDEVRRKRGLSAALQQDAKTAPKEGQHVRDYSDEREKARVASMKPAAPLMPDSYQQHKATSQSQAQPRKQQQQQQVIGTLD